MKKLLFILFASFILFQGCVTQKRCQEKYPPQTFTRDSIVYEDRVVLKDTVIIRDVPGDTIEIEVEVEVFADCPDGVKVPVNISLDTMKVETSTSVAYSWVNNNKMGLRLYQKPQSFKFDLFNKESFRRYESFKYEKEVVEIKYIPAFYKFTFWFSISFFAGVLLYLLIKLKILRIPWF